MLNADELLLITAPNHGGFAILSKEGFQLIDDTSTTGLCINDRAMYRAIQRDDFSEIIVYNRNGNSVSWVHLDINDIHDLLFYDNYLYVVSTSTNEVVKCDMSGTIIKRYVFPGSGDAWHLNCLDVWNERVVVSAFGHFEEHRGFKGKTFESGVVIDLITHKKLITNLSQPHSPKKDSTNIYVCDSETKRLLIFNENGLNRSIQFESYTRGLAFSKDYIFVGLSCSRNIDNIEKPGATIAVVEKKSLTTIKTFQLPFEEVYELKLISSDGLEGFDLTSPFSVVNRYEKQLDERNKTLQEKEEWIKEVSNWGKTLERQLEEQGSILIAKEEWIQELSQWGKKLERELETKDNSIKELESLIQKLNEEKEDKIDSIAANNGVYQMSEVEERDRLIRKLRLKLQNTVEPLVLHQFGPNPITAGCSFNIQPDGSSSIWAKGENISQSCVLFIDEIALNSTVNDSNTITAKVPSHAYSKSGEYNLYIKDMDTEFQSQPIKFIVY